MVTEKVTLELTPAQALILFEWLARLDETKALPADGSPEEKVMWILEGQLETKLAASLLPNYRELLEDARRQVQEDV
jgi:hypothetical protein